jgi:hypothetical protein
VQLHVCVVAGNRSEWKNGGNIQGGDLGVRTERREEARVVVHSTTERSGGGFVVAAWGGNDVGGWTRRHGVDGAQVVVQLIHPRGPGAGGERFEAWRSMASKKLVLAGEGIHDILTRRNWSCNPICSLSFCQPETSVHLLIQCNYAEALWNITANPFNLPSYDVLNAAVAPIQWVQSLSVSGSKRER